MTPDTANILWLQSLADWGDERAKSTLEMLQHEQQKNQELAQSVLTLGQDYEELAAGVGTLRQIIYFMLIELDIDRDTFVRFGFDGQIYETIMSEFGQG